MVAVVAVESKCYWLVFLLHILITMDTGVSLTVFIVHNYIKSHVLTIIAEFVTKLLNWHGNDTVYRCSETLKGYIVLLSLRCCHCPTRLPAANIKHLVICI